MVTNTLRICKVLASILCFGLTAASPTGAATQYTLTPLPPGDAWAINDQGEVVGRRTAGVAAWAWSHGRYRLLPTPNLFAWNSSQAEAINNKGQIAGGIWDGGNSPKAGCALFWDGDQVDAPLDLYTEPFQDLNDNGQAITSEWDANGWLPVVWSKASGFQHLGTMGYKQASPQAINDESQITGWVGSGDTVRAVIWENNEPQYLQGLQDTPSQATDINNSGEVVGGVYDQASNTWHAFSWEKGGAYQDLGIPAVAMINWMKVNDRGQIYAFALASDGPHTYGYEDGQWVSTDESAINRRGWTFYGSFSTGINNRGQIVGSGSDGKQDRGYLLTPIPSPTLSAPSSLHSSPTAVDGVVYVGCDDGKLYARTTADGNPAPGFPVDLSSGRLLARPAVYTQGAQTAIYTTTEDGHVVKVLPNGTVAWSVQPLPGGSSASTPAVTPDGAVYAGLSDASGSYVLKLDASTGNTLKQSASLGSGPVGSPAVQGGSVYVTVENGTNGGILLLDSSDLTVKASFAPNESASTPHVKDGILYVGTDAGNVYKVNSATMALDTAFGTAGHAAIGEAVTTEAFPDSAGHLYVGTGAGKVFQVAAGTGASSLFHDSGGGQAVGGLVLDYDSGLLAYGTAGGDFWQVPTGNVTAATRFPLAGSFTTPTLDRSANAFYAATDAGNLYPIPRL